MKACAVIQNNVIQKACHNRQQGLWFAALVFLDSPWGEGVDVKAKKKTKTSEHFVLSYSIAWINK